jgi:hypothetical protein
MLAGLHWIRRPVWRGSRTEADSNEVQMLTIGQVMTLIQVNKIWRLSIIHGRCGLRLLLLDFRGNRPNRRSALFSYEASERILKYFSAWQSRSQ